ncbi:Crp/Fnr family transcriptional regulator [Dongia sp.]|uniref:Crp/Fnr family transcriptional regulator n=1 Tax=Dongia sp. TaxID=1977262 RepID=UPI0035B14107
MIDSRLLSRFPQLGQLEPEIQQRIAANAHPVALPAGTVVARPGERLPHFVLLTDGTIKVSGISENGREIVLYRVAAGETCVLSSACLLGQTALSAELVAESDVAGFALPEPIFQELMAAGPAFRRLIFANFGERLQEIVTLLEDIAFRRIDARLAAFLLARDAEQPIALTHQDLATELGTAREVVSRQLKDFERRQWLRLTRGRIDLLDRDALSHCATGA